MPNITEATANIMMKPGDKRWFVSDEPFYNPWEFEGFKVTLGDREQLKFYKKQGNTSIKMRLFKNGRFTVEIVKDEEKIYYKKRYVKAPVNGMLHIIPAPQLEDYVIFFRDIELENKMTAINVDRVHAKVSKYFEINDTKWKIREPLIYGKMLDEESFYNVLSNGEIYEKEDGIHIDFNPCGKPIPKDLRYAILTSRNNEGKNDYILATLYLDNGMFTDEVLDEILNKKRNSLYRGAEILNTLDFRLDDITADYIDYKLDDLGILEIIKFYFHDIPKIKLTIDDDGDIAFKCHTCTRKVLCEMIKSFVIHGIKFSEKAN